MNDMKTPPTNCKLNHRQASMLLFSIFALGEKDEQGFPDDNWQQYVHPALELALDSKMRILTPEYEGEYPKYGLAFDNDGCCMNSWVYEDQGYHLDTIEEDEDCYYTYLDAIGKLIENFYNYRIDEFAQELINTTIKFYS